MAERMNRYCSIRSETLITLGVPVVPEESTSRQTSSALSKPLTGRAGRLAAGDSQWLPTSVGTKGLPGSW